MIFFIHFFIKFSGSQTFLEKPLAPFSRKISTFVYGTIGSIVAYCGVCTTFKITLYAGKIMRLIIKNNKKKKKNKNFGAIKISN
jgi:hypothetical protein